MIRKSALQQVSISSVVALGEVATGVGVASASTHATSARALTTVAANAKRNHPSSTRMSPGVPGGIGGDVTAFAVTSITVTDFGGTTSTNGVTTLTTVTKNEQSATLADVLIGNHVRRTVSSTDPTLASTVDIVLASVVGKVTAIGGDDLTMVKPHGESASLSDISVNTFSLTQGTISSSPDIVDATTVGNGGLGPRGPGPGGPGGPRFALPPTMKGLIN
jgi:hypothetical protein